MTCSYSNGLGGFSIRPSGKLAESFSLKLKKGPLVWRIDNVDSLEAALELAMSRNTGCPEWDREDMHFPPEIFNLSPWPNHPIDLRRSRVA